jgi:hypothetical protein
MNVHVVCEDEIGAAIVRQALRVSVSNRRVKVVAGQGRSACVAQARTLAVTTGAPVLLAVNGNTLDDRTAREMRLDLMTLLGQASGGRPYDVVQFLPSVEVVLFIDPVALARALKIPKIARDVLLTAPFEPKVRLYELFKETGEMKLSTRVDIVARNIGAATLQRHPAIQQILAFVRQNASGPRALQAS